MVRLFLTVACLSLFLVAGCDSGPSMSPVSGKVTIGGQPAPENTLVNFVPVDPAIMAASGKVDASGDYILYSGNEGKEGAMVGKYKVYLSPDMSGSSYMEAGKPPEMSAGAIPEKYTKLETTDKEVEVTSGSNTINIEL